MYPSADGSFTLYDDDNYNYEKGLYATTKLRWNDKAHQLTVGDRRGLFPGMQPARTFRVILVDKQHGTGLSDDGAPAKAVPYADKHIKLKL
jgi:alpha-D-xyloside xylohydrolase